LLDVLVVATAQQRLEDRREWRSDAKAQTRGRRDLLTKGPQRVHQASDDPGTRVREGSIEIEQKSHEAVCVGGVMGLIGRSP
jgi:hypothetical protein